MIKQIIFKLFPRINSKFEYINRDQIIFNSENGNQYIINGERLASRNPSYSMSKNSIILVNSNAVEDNETRERLLVEMKSEFERCRFNVEINENSFTVDDIKAHLKTVRKEHFE